MSQPAPLDVKKAEKKLWLIKVSCLVCEASVYTLMALKARLRHRCPSTWRSSGRPHLQTPPAPEGALDQSWAVCALPAAHRHVWLCVLERPRSTVLLLSLLTTGLRQTLLQAAPDLQLTLTNVERTNLPRDYLMRAQNGAMAAMHLLAERPGHLSALAALWLPLAGRQQQSSLHDCSHTLFVVLGRQACTAADPGSWLRGRAAVCCITPATPDSLRFLSSCVLCADRRGGSHRPEV